MDAETLRQSLLSLLTPKAHPLTAFRIDQILALHRIVTQLEEALASNPVLIQDPKRGPRLHPLLDALAKNRERLRRAINDLERTLPKPPRTRKEDKGLHHETAEKGSVDAPIGQHTSGDARYTNRVGADLRVRPAPNKYAPPINPTRANLLRNAQTQLHAP